MIFLCLKKLLWGLRNLFTKDSGLVKVWVSLILAGVYTYDDVPNLSNLREVVKQVLEELGYVFD